MGKAGAHRKKKAHAPIDAVLARAVVTAVTPDGRRRPPAPTLISHLVERRREATGALERALLAVIAQVWSLHWQPADVVRAVARDRGDLPARLVGRAIVRQVATYAPGPLPPRWRAQIDAFDMGDLGVDATSATSDGDGSPGSWLLPDDLAGDRLKGSLAAAVEALALLQVLPSLPRIGPLPGDPVTHRPVDTSQVDSTVLQRVTALLAKAESTTFTEEAEALTAKAQELMARHAIDMALVEANRRRREGQPDQVASARRMGVDDPYAGAKAILLQELAEANRCRSVWSKVFGFATVFGDEVDLDAVELLYTSLLVQSARAMISTKPPRKASPASTRSFRRSFLVAFATRIGERLREAVEEAVRSTGEAQVDLLPVLAARESAADDACREAFPTLRTTSTTATNVEGWHAGRSAADRAHLDLDDSIGSGHDDSLATTALP